MRCRLRDKGCILHTTSYCIGYQWSNGMRHVLANCLSTFHHRVSAGRLCCQCKTQFASERSMTYGEMRKGIHCPDHFKLSLTNIRNGLHRCVTCDSRASTWEDRLLRNSKASTGNGYWVAHSSMDHISHPIVKQWLSTGCTRTVCRWDKRFLWLGTSLPNCSWIYVAYLVKVLRVSCRMWFLHI